MSIHNLFMILRLYDNAMYIVYSSNVDSPVPVTPTIMLWRLL